MGFHFKKVCTSSMSNVILIPHGSTSPQLAAGKLIFQLNRVVMWDGGDLEEIKAVRCEH